MPYFNNVGLRGGFEEKGKGALSAASGSGSILLDPKQVSVVSKSEKQKKKKKKLSGRPRRGAPLLCYWGSLTLLVACATFTLFDGGPDLFGGARPTIYLWGPVSSC